jgi:hypothetical protein
MDQLSDSFWGKEKERKREENKQTSSGCTPSL